MKAARRLTPKLLQEQFGLIVEAALNGERCPQVEPYGPIIQNALRRMNALGWVSWDVGYRSFRVAKILIGEHAGKVTAPNPHVPVGMTPWMPPPSAPRPLTREELERS